MSNSTVQPAQPSATESSREVGTEWERTITIPLTQGQVAIIDEVDADLAKLKWFAEKREQTYYATRNRSKANGAKPGILRLHHAVMGKPPPDMEVDHINGDGLDNRRCNLRFVTCRQNQGNRRKHQTKTYTRFKGVFRYPYKRKPWGAQIRFDGKTRWLGSFATEEEAARAYDAAAVAAYGREYARINFSQAAAA